MGKVPFAALLLGVWVAALPCAVRATDLGARGPEAQWKESDKCSQDAFKKYPDYTPETNVKREAFRRECLRDQHIAAPDTPLPQVGGAGQ